MEKRYQVFVSSTYADLHEERQEVMQALLELDCIPAGMELFPAANEDQWTLIKKVIDDCDYYIVILGGRYGSIGPDGISYTEMEYRYALDSGKPVIAFIHKDPGQLTAKRCETSDKGKEKLEEFRDLVKQKVCRFWESPADLGSQVSRSLIRLTKDHPAIGWVRGDLVPDVSASEEILRLRQQIEGLETKLASVRLDAPQGTASFAQGEDSYAVEYWFRVRDKRDFSGTYYSGITHITWNDIFATISPMMIDEASDQGFRKSVDQLLGKLAHPRLPNNSELCGKHIDNISVSDEAFQTIKVQLRALGLITKSTKTRSVKDNNAYWTLTPYGDTVMTRLRAIKKTAPNG